MKTYKIHLIRHGLTEANLKGIYCGGLTDIPICDEGRADLAELFEQASYPYVDVVYTSPMLRARETAEILFPGCEAVVDQSMIEASFGRFEGRPLDELKNDEEFCRWAAPASGFVPDGVEPAEQFWSRVTNGFINIVNDLMRSGARSAAIITHADVISTIMASLAYPKGEPYDWNAQPGYGYTVMADPSLFMREPVVEAVSMVPIFDEYKDDDSFADDWLDN